MLLSRRTFRIVSVLESEVSVGLLFPFPASAAYVLLCTWKAPDCRHEHVLRLGMILDKGLEEDMVLLLVVENSTSTGVEAFSCEPYSAWWNKFC